MRGAQEMLSVLDRHQLRVARVDKHLDLLLRIGHRVDDVAGALSHSDETSVSLHTQILKQVRLL